VPARFPGVETAVLDDYSTITLPHGLRDRITALMNDALAGAAGFTAELPVHFAAQRVKVDAQEDRFLGVVGDPSWPDAKTAARLRIIRDAHVHLAQQSDDTGTPRSTLQARR
jgi:hypothetical protein